MKNEGEDKYCKTVPASHTTAHDVRDGITLLVITTENPLDPSNSLSEQKW